MKKERNKVKIALKRAPMYRFYPCFDHFHVVNFRCTLGKKKFRLGGLGVLIGPRQNDVLKLKKVKNGF